MNSRIINKVMLQSLRHSHCRYLSVQQNINKCSSTCHTVNLHKRNENRSSSFVFTKFPHNRTLCQSTLPTYTSFQRNLSSTPLLSQAASAEPLKKVADVASPPAEVTENVLSSWFSPEVADSSLVGYIQQLIMQMHESTELPWWASIALTAFFLRATITLPFAITQLRVMAGLEKVSMSMESVEKKLKKETVRAQKELGWPEKLAKEKYDEATNKAWWDMVKKENCHPVKAYLLVSFQVSLFATATVATATMCDPNIIGPSIYNQLTTGGFGWIKNLTVVDPYLILPISLSLVNLIIVEVHQSFKISRTSATEQWKCAAYRATSIAMLPLAATLPAAVNVYWLSSSLYGLLQALLLNSSLMRKLFRVPVNDPELKHPYRFALKNFKEKFKSKRRQAEIATK